MIMMENYTILLSIFVQTFLFGWHLAVYNCNLYITSTHNIKPTELNGLCFVLFQMFKGHFDF